MRSAQGAYEEIFSFLEALSILSDPLQFGGLAITPTSTAKQNELEAIPAVPIWALRAFTEHWPPRSAWDIRCVELTREIPASCGVE